jgi:hypothetical protein
MGLGSRISKAYYLNAAIGFIVLGPVMIYKFYVSGWPKLPLLIIVPAYIVLATGFYELFNNVRSK